MQNSKLPRAPTRPGDSAKQSEEAAAGQGMPAKTPRPQAGRTGNPATPHDQSVETSLEMPHERDQATDMTAAAPDPKIEQAARDVANGLEDTSKGAEMDATYRKVGRKAAPP
ncbi:MAG: hypothetical protein LH479_08370 [Polaromonas sp.]|nr:hypothetical protein [Polaromonas sp.]